MKPDSKEDQRLEATIHRALRALPPQPAPLALEGRVLAAVNQRATGHRWARGFRDWPVLAKAGFFPGSAVAAQLLFMAWGWAGASPAETRLAELGAPLVAHGKAAASLADSAIDLGSAVFQSIPPDWLYLSAAILAVTYLGFFGLGAIAYRAFRQAA